MKRSEPVPVSIIEEMPEVSVCPSASQEKSSPPFPKSKVWIFFEKISAQESKCKTCKKVFKTPTSSTSTLLRHLDVHPSVKEKFEAENKEKKKTLLLKLKARKKPSQLTLEQSTNKTSKLDANCPRAKQITKQLACMIAQDYQPFSIVEDPGFKKLVNLLEPKYNLPSRSSLARTVVPNLYQEKKAELMTLIAEEKSKGLKSLSVTIDLWTSRAKESYISLTIHFITEMFTLERYTLGCSHFPGSHTGEAVYFKLVEMLKEWDLVNNSIPIYVVTDNASNMKAALSNKPLWSHISCMLHSIQLAINDAKEGLGVGDLLKNARAIVGHYRHSTQARERLRSLQERLKLPCHELVNMVETRWNSEYLMLSRLIEQEEAISAELSKNGKVKNLSPAAWHLAEGLVTVLSPVEEATRELSREDVPTISMVIPILFNIEYKVQEHITKAVHGSGLMFARNLLLAFKTRFAQIRQSKLHLLSMLLDPRFKGVVLGDEERSESIELLLNTLKESHSEIVEATSTEITLSNRSKKVILLKHSGVVLKIVSYSRNLS